MKNERRIRSLLERGRYAAAMRLVRPKPVWVAGDGRYAVFAWCVYPTIMLWGSRHGAEAGKATIDKGGCGGGCHNDHVIIDLDDWASVKAELDRKEVA